MSHDSQDSLDPRWPELPRHGAERFGLTSPTLSATTVPQPHVEVSVIVPLYNEYENVQPLYVELTEVLAAQPRSFELILVDDGSTDGTVERLKALAESDEHLKLVLLRRNFGQTAAMQAGIDSASGDYLVTLDGDLQNDPRDIPQLLEKLDEGFDLVHGWRRDRKDHWLSRKLPSRLANRLISKVTDFPVHDLGCTLKAMRREIAEDLRLYGEMHRFIPILAHRQGARCVEVVTNHRPRIHGETKYGLGRTFRVLFDLLTVHYMQRYFTSPMKLFGKLGGIVGLIAVTAMAMSLAMKVFMATDLTGNPLLLLGILSAVLSVQFFSLGLIGEVCARIYYSHPRNSSYRVREEINFHPPVDNPIRITGSGRSRISA